MQCGVRRLLQRLDQGLHGLQQHRRDTFGADLLYTMHAQREASVLGMVVDRHHQWIVGAFLAAELLYRAQRIVLGQGVVGDDGAAACVAIVEQGIQQRQGGIHIAAALGQRERCMFVMQQLG